MHDHGDKCRSMASPAWRRFEAMAGFKDASDRFWRSAEVAGDRYLGGLLSYNGGNAIYKCFKKYGIAWVNYPCLKAEACNNTQVLS